ncbi:uncharacterized protein LOC122093736 [Macadamia integrifolia]|uniref:uncharacterized protein LOC122093736 n=1 Tax=Macadamia integrifolia TaxID=60698 RepID=UPI001C52D4C7|nr:uncharacterized protein LOC122093736 [Macadamia integrifolia]
MVLSSAAFRSSLTMATEKASFPPPPLSWKMSGVSGPRVRVRVRVSSLITSWKRQIPWIHLMLFLFNLVTVSSRKIKTSSASYASQISYHDHCNSVVPESTSRGLKLFEGDILMIRNGYFVGGDRILGNNSQLSFNFPKYVSFRPKNVYQTEASGVLMVEGNLDFRSPNTYSYLGNSTFGRSPSGRLRHRSPRFPVRRGGANFRLQGFWSASTGRLCMVGSGLSYSKREGKFLDISGVFKLTYPENSTILTSLVTGTLESLDTVDSLKYFEPISILAFSQSSYEYSLINKEIDNGFSRTTNSAEKELSRSLQSSKGICSILRRPANAFELKYRGDCDAAATNCTPLGRSTGFLPGFMSFGEVRCSNEQKMRLLLVFSNISFIGYNQPLDPKMTLVGEGAWDGEKNQLCVVACRILNFTDSLTRASIGDCSIRLNLRFPTVLSIRNRSTVVGQIWSNATANDSGDFDRVIFQAPEYGSPVVPGLKYEYTMMGGLSKLCEIKSVKNMGKKYADGYSYDMKFDMSVKNDLGQLTWGYATPLFVGDQFYEKFSRSLILVSDEEGAVSEVSTQNHSSQLNVSYTIGFTIPPEFKFGGGFLPSTNTHIAISGEGIYNGETGSLCMVGCRALDSNHKISAKNDPIDCEISINVQFPPLDAKIGSHVKGTIKSTREKSHPLYFKSLELSSSGISVIQAEESLWRMDLEITMVLISNTLACVFIGLQLHYVKKHLDMVPFISLVMLFTLTLGLMIPLLLNFEALFMADRNRQTVLLESGGWLEVNEVIVRAVTMVAFLLQFRLLQQAWSTRWSDGSHKGLWTAEIKALYVTLPLYLLGGLIAWFVHWKHNYDEAPIIRNHFVANHQQHSLWGDMRSYAGLVLDGFLLPQILFNLFLNSKEKALAPSFYFGTTVVRLLPHAYDLYRAHKYAHSFDVSYIYASHGVDFYSTAWDVIIPCGGMLFAIIIYIQQRFGGRCILPSKFRESVLYEKVPVVSS